MLDKKKGRVNSVKYRFGRPEGFGKVQIKWGAWIALVLSAAVVAGLLVWLF